jgi:hypothetical protein
MNELWNLCLMKSWNMCSTKWCSSVVSRKCRRTSVYSKIKLVSQVSIVALYSSLSRSVRLLSWSVGPRSLTNLADAAAFLRSDAVPAFVSYYAFSQSRVYAVCPVQPLPHVCCLSSNHFPMYFVCPVPPLPHQTSIEKYTKVIIRWKDR